MSLDQVTLTDQGLLNINRKIINDRKFSASLISTEGSVTFEGANASEFDKTSYLYKSDLVFTGSNPNETVSIVIEGSYLESPTNSNQTVWYFSSPEGQFILQFVNNYPQIVLPSGSSINFNYLSFTNGMTFKIITEISPQKCSATVSIENEIFQKSMNLTNTINLSTYNSIYVGNNPSKITTEENFFWEGSLNVRSLLIEENSETIFTPTLGYDLSFTSIAISDGKYELPLNGTPPVIYRHLYTYDIEQITRSNNTLLLSTELSNDSKLVIRKIGLYAKVNGEEFLFGYIDNLNIDKGSEVPYDLVITVDLAISTVNVVGFPDANSFILEQVEPVLLKNFTKVQNTNAYVIESLERIIRMNSLEPIKRIGNCYDGISKEVKHCCDNPSTIQSIGYNTPQIVYKLQKTINQQEDCYSAVQTYSKLHKKFIKKSETQFIKDSIVVHGDLNVSPNGQTSSFTTANFVEVSRNIYMDSNWEFDLSFSINNSASHGCLLALGEQTMETEGDLITGTSYESFLTLTVDDGVLKANSTIISNLFTGVKYYVKLEFNSYNYTLQISISEDGETYSSPITIPSLSNISTITAIFIGVDVTYILQDNTTPVVTSAPFIYGTAYLMDWNLSQENNNWYTKQVVLVNNNKLLQYYHIMDYNRLFYKLEDLNNPEYFLDFTESTFKGNADLLDFSKNFSLCLKVNLKDSYSKLLLAKTNLEKQELLKLEFIRTENEEEVDTTYNFKLSILNSDDTTGEIISETIPSSRISDYINNQFLLTITKEGSNVSFYRNNQPLGSTSPEGSEIDFENLPSYEGSYLTNSLSEESRANKYLKDIILIENVINSKQLYYITNLTDTNFEFVN